MPQGHAEPVPSAGHDETLQAALIELSLDVVDHAGKERQGRAVLLPRWPAGPASGSIPDDEDFRIVILSEPLEGSVSPGEGVVVSVPARRLQLRSAAVKEPAATYGTRERVELALSPKDMELLRQGRLFAATPLQVTADDVFTGGKARLALLARDLLASSALTIHLNHIAIALDAPGAAKPASQERLEELKDLVMAVSAIEPRAEASAVERALANISELASTTDSEHFLACVQRLYPNDGSLMEDIYMLRAFRQSPDEASELMAMQHFLQQALVPAEEAELAVDRFLAAEQLSFVVLAVEPHRLPPAKAMVQSFRRKYVSEYRQHHTRYWAQMAHLHARLREEQALVEAVRRLNTLAELGPPAGVGAVAAYEELVAETAGCPLIGGVEEMLETEAVCPACHLSMGQPAPVQRIDEILLRIQRACERQRARLSSSAVQQVLRRSNNARVEQFLRMVQASQLSSLPDILDDELTGYLRRFLVESRIEGALQPILDQLQEGVQPKVDDAQTAMREISQVLQRAFQAAQRALPPGDTAANGGPNHHKRKR